MRYVAYKDRKRVAAELRPVYAAANIDAAEQALAAFDDAWGERYPMIAESWRARWEHITHSWPCRPTSAGRSTPRMKNSRGPGHRHRLGVALACGVGVVDPGAKRRIWGFVLPRSLPRRGP